MSSRLYTCTATRKSGGNGCRRGRGHPSSSLGSGRLELRVAYRPSARAWHAGLTRRCHPDRSLKVSTNGRQAAPQGLLQFTQVCSGELGTGVQGHQRESAKRDWPVERKFVQRGAQAATWCSIAKILEVTRRRGVHGISPPTFGTGTATGAGNTGPVPAAVEERGLCEVGCSYAVRTRQHSRQESASRVGGSSPGLE